MLIATNSALSHPFGWAPRSNLHNCDALICPHERGVKPHNNMCFWESHQIYLRGFLGGRRILLFFPGWSKHMLGGIHRNVLAKSPEVYPAFKTNYYGDLFPKQNTT